VASVIFLILLWVGRDNVPLWIAFMMAFPIVWSNVREGLLQTDGQLLEMAKVFEVPKFRVLLKLRLPALTPYFLSACRSAIALAWKAGIAAEIIALPRRSIGTMISNAKQYLNTEEMFAWTLAVVILSLLIEVGFVSLWRKLEKRTAGKEDLTC
jgi:NitT/TauT family transport system permease protein